MKKWFWLQGTRFLDLKGKCIFGKHHVIRRNLELYPLLLGLECRRTPASLKSSLETTWRSCRTKLNRFSFPVNTSVSLVNSFWVFWLWEFDFRKKGEELWSYTFKMSFTDLPHRSSGFLWRKEYPAIHRKTMNIML